MKKILLIILMFTIFLDAGITLPDNFESNFKQTITNDKGKVIKYSGRVYFKADRETFLNKFNQQIVLSSKLFKWIYASPTKKDVCSDGTQIIIIDHDLEQISKYLIDDGLDLERVLGVAQKISRKDYKAVYKNIEYLITMDRNNHLSKIFYVDSLDNRVRIIFSGMKYNNPRFNSSNLECPENPNYDVIEE